MSTYRHRLYVLFFKKREIKNILSILPFRQRLRFFIRIVLQTNTALSWLEYINSVPVCRCASSRQLYRRLQKPLRPYLNRAFGAEQRLSHLRSHFEALKRIFPEGDPHLAQLKTSGLLLASFSGKSQQHYQLVLAETDHFDREGELRLTLRDADTHRHIAVLAFTLSQAPKPSVYIGCLQGPAAGGSDLVRRITRDFYGIRPKNLLMFALYDLAEVWHLEEIKAIDNCRRIYAKGLLKSRKHARADYEAFWMELGGIASGKGWFTLPRQLTQKPLEAVVSKHRAEHRRKLELRSLIRTQIRTSPDSLEVSFQPHSAQNTPAKASSVPASGKSENTPQPGVSTAMPLTNKYFTPPKWRWYR